jgi:hypothetical protein
LLKQSLLAGYLPLPAAGVTVPLKQGETLHWQSSAEEHRKGGQGDREWCPKRKGSLYLTNERIIFHSPQNKPWQRPIGRIVDSVVEHWGWKTILAVRVDDLTHPIGFSGVDTQVSVPYDGRLYPLNLAAPDFIQLLRSLK